jgi:hypothetical protein
MYRVELGKSLRRLRLWLLLQQQEMVIEEEDYYLFQVH